MPAGEGTIRVDEGTIRATFTALKLNTFQKK